MKHNIVIDAQLSIHPVEGFDYLTQHSVGTKFIIAKLDKWTLAQGENLFIAFEKAREDENNNAVAQLEEANIINSIDPILMSRSSNGLFFTVIPTEVVHDDGTWKMSIYKKFNWNKDTGRADAVEVGTPYTFSVVSTIVDNSGNAITQYDLINALRTFEELNGGTGLYGFKVENGDLILVKANEVDRNVSYRIDELDGTLRIIINY